jgi:hypothetical protein
VLAGGFDMPYVQAQVGHRDAAVTLSVYAQVIRRPTAIGYEPKCASFSVMAQLTTPSTRSLTQPYVPVTCGRTSGKARKGAERELSPTPAPRPQTKTPR